MNKYSGMSIYESQNTKGTEAQKNEKNSFIGQVQLVSFVTQMKSGGSIMKKHLMMISCFVSLVIICGCSVYKATVDERNVRTIASDDKIAVTVSKRFFDDATIKILDISADCYNGHVYLVGEYENEKQKNKAVKIASSVEGVKSVTTYLLPKKKGDLCGTSDNLAIIAKVKAGLVKDKEIWSTNIKVKSVQCNVVLLGIVGSKAEIHKIVDHIKSVEGIRSVKSFLKSIK